MHTKDKENVPVPSGTVSTVYLEERIKIPEGRRNSNNMTGKA